MRCTILRTQLGDFTISPLCSSKLLLKISVVNIDGQFNAKYNSSEQKKRYENNQASIAFGDIELFDN